MKYQDSKYFHIGGDETYLLGSCPKCREKVEEFGKSRLFVDYMVMICEVVKDLGKIPVMWADIILKYPEAVSRLPRETVFVDWNYGWDINTFGNVSNLIKKGCNFWGAPAVRSAPDDYGTTQWDKHFKNIHDFIVYARKADYSGIVMTSWSTSGLYGFEFGESYNPIAMHPIRNVYPLSGFRILVAAYAHALRSDEALEINKFIIGYFEERFDVSRQTAKKMSAILLAPQLTLANGRMNDGTTIKSSIKKLNRDVDFLNSLSISRNKKEFRHIRLMLNIRCNYLMFKDVEVYANKTSVKAAKLAEMSNELVLLLTREKSLSVEFARLQKGYLYDSEIELENKTRSRPMELLYNRLIGNRGMDRT